MKKAMLLFGSFITATPMFAQKTEVFTSIRIGDMHYSGNSAEAF
ncbi:hypothetical protein ACVW0P_002096 [Mucilaginibacter sp. UYNi724]